MEGKKGIAMVGIAAFVIFSLVLSPVMSLTGSVTLSNSGSIQARAPLVTGLPSANVYVVRDDSTGNYVTLNGSNTAQVLETNTNPVTAINDAITNWVPTNGKLVTNGTMADWSGTVQPTHGNFTWEAWKTKATQVSSSSSLVSGVNILYSYVTVNNFTYVGRNSTGEIGIRASGVNYVTIENCSITGCYGQFNAYGALSIAGGVGHSIRFNNVSFNYYATQILFNTVSDSVISNNTVNAGGNGQCIGDFGYSGTYHQNVNVTYNMLYNWGQNPDHGYSMLWHGFYNSGTAYSHIYNNTFTNIEASCGADMGIKSACNYIYDNTFNGQNHDWAVTMFQQGGAGDDWFLSPNGTMFYNNTLKNYAIGGLVFSSGPPYATGNMTVANNTFINCSTGIQLVGQPTDYDQNMTFIGNSFTTGTYGIRTGFNDAAEWWSESIKILNNTMTSETYGIWIHAGTMNAIVEYNTFISCTNVIYDTGPTPENTTFRFNIGLTGYYMLNVTAVGSGTTSPSGLGWQYSSGSTASVAWTPSAGHVRQNISIDGINQSTTVSPIDVTMSANHVVIAYFI